MFGFTVIGATEVLYRDMLPSSNTFVLPWNFSRQEFWSGLPFPSPGDLPNIGIEHRSPVLQADSLQSEPQGKPSCIPKLHSIKSILLISQGATQMLQCFSASIFYSIPRTSFFKKNSLHFNEVDKLFLH